MRLLLDTHALTWSDSEPERLSQSAYDAIESGENEVLLSVGSLWEIQVKIGVGKLDLRAPLAELLRDQEANGMRLLGVEPAHVFALGALPLHHRDPFDRMLAAQAVAEGARLVTRDGVFVDYAVQTLW